MSLRKISFVVFDGSNPTLKSCPTTTTTTTVEVPRLVQAQIIATTIIRMLMSATPQALHLVAVITMGIRAT